MSDAEQAFLSAMRQAGLRLGSAGLIADGQIHRCDVEGKRSGNKDGSYQLHVHSSNCAFGWLQNWVAGHGVQKWSYRRPGWQPTRAEQEAIARDVEEAHNAHTRELARMRTEAREKANGMWEGAETASASFPYCERKQVEPKGLKTYRFRGGDTVLLVPVHDEENFLVNLQLIDPDGGKKFLFGGRKQNCHHWVARPNENRTTICVAEGWATAESIFQATGHAVVMAFDCYNLLPVARWVRENHPSCDLVLCADDDWKTEGGNPGLRCAYEAARAVNGKVAVPVFVGERKDEWTDFNDMMQQSPSREGGLAAVRRAIEEAMPAEQENAMTEADDTDDTGEDGGDLEDMKQSDQLIALAVRGAKLFHSSDHTAYADIRIGDHSETYPIKAGAFHRWLTGQYYRATEGAPNPTAMNSALAVLMAKAQYEGEEREVHLRVAGHGNCIYLDLVDKDWHVVEIDADGWRLVNNAPVKFIRRKGGLALPVPVPGGSINRLRKYLNIKPEDQHDFVLLVAWLLAALRPRGPYPVLSVTGEAGSAKSTLLRILRSLIDPNQSPLRAAPREERDLFIAANNAYVLCYDNLSWLPDWFSDALSRIATEGSFATRQLFTDDEERLFTAMRSVLLGAIDDIITKGDLADRAIALLLTPIVSTHRRPEEELWQEFQRDIPQILGALLDAVSHGLQQYPETQHRLKEQKLPRMADFYIWVTACGDGLLWDEGKFAAAYWENRDKVTETVVESDSLTAAVRKLMEVDHGEWTGTMTLLLDRLNGIAGENEIRRRHWPSSPSALGRRIRSIASPLRRYGIDIKPDREGRRGGRIVTITWADRADGTDSADSNPQTSGAEVETSRFRPRPIQEGPEMPSVPSALSAEGSLPRHKRLKPREFSAADSADSTDSTDSNPRRSTLSPDWPSAERPEFQRPRPRPKLRLRPRRRVDPRRG
jgi:phage/plasmid primase-like uncharacterized protein